MVKLRGACGDCLTDGWVRIIMVSRARGRDRDQELFGLLGVCPAAALIITQFCSLWFTVGKEIVGSMVQTVVGRRPVCMRRNDSFSRYDCGVAS